MKRNNKNLMLIAMIFTVSLIISNVVTAKLFDTGIIIFGIPVGLPGAAICYCITFLATDIVGEIWGKDEANQIVKFGFIGQVAATVLILITEYIPAVDPEMQNAYEMLLGQNWIFVAGSLAGYFCSQLWDVWIFHKVRDNYIKKLGYSASRKKRWVWNNLSTMTSQVIDTVIFIGISFGIGFGWLFDKNMWPTLIAMIIGQYIWKLILAALDTPFFYFFTRNAKE